MGDIADLVIFWIIVLLRILVPVTIPRFPLPGIIAALLLDAIDQSLFQALTDLALDSYQGYDKALDIYYLAIAYIATMRNWNNQWAFRISRFLFYYRLLGAALWIDPLSVAAERRQNAMRQLATHFFDHELIEKTALVRFVEEY